MAAREVTIVAGLVLAGCSGDAPRVAAEAPRVVEVIGRVSGWDHTGDVAVEACGMGTLVDEDGGFVLATAPACALRVVWERDGARAEGGWRELVVRDGVARMVLPMPDAAALRALTDEEAAEREAYRRAAQRQLALPELPEPCETDGEPGA